MKKDKKSSIKNLSNRELIETCLDQHKKYKKCTLISIMGIAIEGISVLPIGTALQLLFIAVGISVSFTSLPIATFYFIKYFMAYREIKKRGISEDEIDSIYNENYENSLNITKGVQEENIEPCPTFENVFPEFKNVEENKKESKEYTFKR